MARRIRAQIVIALFSALLVTALMGNLALRSAVARPVAGGTYVEALIGAPQHLHPLLLDPANQSGADIAALLFDGLTRIGADGLPEPALARSWDVDPEGRVYTFYLRQGVSWHDGAPVTVDDVLFTFESIRSRTYPGDPVLAALWRNVLVERVDDYTLRTTLTAPYAGFLASASVPIVPRHLLADTALEAWAQSPFSRQPVGTGPYQLEDLTTERALLRANPRYYGGRPLLERLEFRFFTTVEAAQAALERGVVQGMGWVPVRAAGGAIAIAAALRIEHPLDEYTTLTFNLRIGALMDVELRRALAQALDKDLVIQLALDGRARRLDTPVLPGWWAYDPEAPWYPYNPEVAARTLGILGYVPGPDGVRTRGAQRLSFELITDGSADRLAAANEIAAQWGLIGVELRVSQLDGPALIERLEQRDFMIALHGVTRLGVDPDAIYGLWHSSQVLRGANYAGLADADIDLLLATARQDQNLESRRVNYAAFQRRWIELVPAIPLYQPTYVYTSAVPLGGFGFDQPGVLGNTIFFGRTDRFRNVARWFLNSTQEIRGDLRYSGERNP